MSNKENPHITLEELAGTIDFIRKKEAQGVDCKPLWDVLKPIFNGSIRCDLTYEGIEIVNKDRDKTRE
jgi:hypothetical protein